MASKKECCQEFITAIAKNKANHDESTKKLQKARSQNGELTRRLGELKSSLLTTTSETEKTELNNQIRQLLLDQKTLNELIDKNHKYIKNTLEPNSNKLTQLRDDCFTNDYNSEHACNDPSLAPKCCDGYKSTNDSSTGGINGKEQRLKPTESQDTYIRLKDDINSGPKPGELAKGIDQYFIDETVPININQSSSNKYVSPTSTTPLQRQQQSANSIQSSNTNSIIGPASPPANIAENLTRISDTVNIRGSKSPASIFLNVVMGGTNELKNDKTEFKQPDFEIGLPGEK